MPKPELRLRLVRQSPFMQIVCALLLLSALFGFSQAPPDYRFKGEILAEGMNQPMELEVAPDGRIFYNEINGKLKIYKPDTRDVVEVGELQVFTAQENGFLGFALDPQFTKHNYIYLFYSPKDYVGQRLSRFVLNGDKLEMASEKRILEFGEQRRDCCHHAGSVEFGPDGLLFISTGDNTHPGGESSGYAPIDERPNQEPFDAQKASANSHDLRGKILRIHLTVDGGYTIPDGNLFPKDGSKGRPEIFVMGCRNPWRMSVDQKTGFVYWGEVGPDAGGDNQRGPRGYDEINQARRAGNFGWPYFVGSNFAYADWDFVTKTAGPKFDANAPTNLSPNNTGSKVLPPAQPAFIYWPYGESKEFPMLGTGGRTACAGPVFDFKPQFKETGGFPDYYDRCLLFYDWERPFIKWARLDSDSRLVSIEPFTAAFTVTKDRDKVKAAQSRGEFVIQRVVDSQFGADGCLYILDYGESWGANKDSRLVKISYQWGNIAPIAKISSDKSAGREPLRVNFSSAGSKDHEGDKLAYEWRVFPGSNLISTAENPSYNFKTPGNFVIELTTKDSHGAQAKASMPIVVGNSAPELSFVEPRSGDFFTPGKPVSYKVRIKDLEDGDSKDGGELQEGRTFVSVSWMGADGKAEEVEPGLAHIKQNDCFNCHATEQRIVGPAFLEIAAKYKTDPTALEQSVARVIKGSSGVWGEVPMLPHEALNPDQVRMMVRWIYGLTPDKTSANTKRGLEGEFTAPTDSKFRNAKLEATYVDYGREPAGSLSGSTTIQLRHRKLEAEYAEEKHGLKILGNMLGAIDHNHYARFANINLATSKSVTFRAASAGQGGKIELRIGSPNGDLLASVEVKPTGGWDKWIELDAPLQTSFRGDVYVVFTNPGKGGLMNLDWVRFNP